MKRSEINKAIRELEAMCKKYNCYLPPFCDFTPEQWQTKGHEYDEVRECMLGWDITDYGLGKFDELGFSLITIRNGNRKMADKYPKVYAEKLLYLKEGQFLRTISTGTRPRTSSTAAVAMCSSASTIPKKMSPSTMNPTLSFTPTEKRIPCLPERRSA